MDIHDNAKLKRAKTFAIAGIIFFLIGFGILLYVLLFKASTSIGYGIAILTSMTASFIILLNALKSLFKKKQ